MSCRKLSSSTIDTRCLNINVAILRCSRPGHGNSLDDRAAREVSSRHSDTANTTIIDSRLPYSRRQRVSRLAAETDTTSAPRHTQQRQGLPSGQSHSLVCQYNTSVGFLAHSCARARCVCLSLVRWYVRLRSSLLYAEKKNEGCRMLSAAVLSLSLLLSSHCLRRFLESHLSLWLLLLQSREKISAK